MQLEFDNTEIAFKHKTTGELQQARLLFSSMGMPWLSRLGMGLTQWAINIGLPVKSIIKKTIFKQFCGGETMEEAARTADKIAQAGVSVILDYGVEGKEGEDEFDKAVPEFIKAIKFAASRKNIPFISIKITGFARFKLLERVHEKNQLTEAEQSEWEKVKQRVDQICAATAEHKIMVLIDAEESWIQHAVNELAETMMKQYNIKEAIVFNTFQLYTTSALPHLKYSYEKAVLENYILGAKLVRGAYMEKERKRAAEMNYTSPIQPDKHSTDKDYNEAVIFCLQRMEQIATFIGTHNEQSCMIAAKYLDDKGLPHSHPRVWFSQLFGMSDNISFNLAHAGYHVAKYLPYGPVKDVIPYLMRRAQENTSVAGQTGRELSLIHKELKRRQAV